MIILSATISNTTIEVYQSSIDTWYVSEKVSGNYTVLTESGKFYDVESAMIHATTLIENIINELYA